MELVGIGCGTIADRIQPATYALMATAKVGEAEQRYRRVHTAFGTLQNLEADNILDSVRFKQYEAGAKGFSFQLQCSGDEYLFRAQSDSGGQKSYSVDQTGNIRTITATEIK